MTRLSRIGGPRWGVTRRRLAPRYDPLDDPALVAWYHPDSGRWQDQARTTPATATGHALAVWDNAAAGIGGRPAGTHLRTPEASPTLLGTVVGADPPIVGTLAGHLGTVLANIYALRAPLALGGPNLRIVAVLRVEYIYPYTWTSTRLFQLVNAAGGNGAWGESSAWSVMIDDQARGTTAPTVSSYRDGYAAAATVPVAAPFILEATSGATSTTVAINAAIGTGTHAAAPISADSFDVGWYPNGGTYGALWELLIFDGQSAENRAANADRLKAKYGITF